MVYIFKLEERTDDINKMCVEHVVFYYPQHMSTVMIWLTISPSVCCPFMRNKLNVSFSVQNSEYKYLMLGPFLLVSFLSRLVPLVLELDWDRSRNTGQKVHRL